MIKSIAVLLTFLGISSVVAQSEIPAASFLARVLMVRSQYEQGSIFFIDVDNREYWITAKHLLTGAKHPPYGSITTRSASLRILNPNAESEQWMPVNFSVLDPGENIDIVVLVPPRPLMSSAMDSVKVGGNVMFGGECLFLGFPHGGSWRISFGRQSFWLPYIKHCTVSAIDVIGQERQRIFVLDGINNVGFSGGPVIYGTAPDQLIMAVISGYVSEPAEVISSVRANPTNSARAKKPGRHKKQMVNLNSGFILAYDIEYAIDAIHKNPIGPLRVVQ